MADHLAPGELIQVAVGFDSACACRVREADSVYLVGWCQGKHFTELARVYWEIAERTRTGSGTLRLRMWGHLQARHN